jgi:hypothetical protein
MPTPTPHQLIDRRAQMARLTDQAVSVFDRELALVVRHLERQLRGLVASVAEGSRTAIIKAARASRLRNELRNVLTESGFDALLDHATDLPLDRLARAALRTEVGQDVAAFVVSLQPRIAALKALTLSDLLGQGDQVAHALWRATVHGVFSARPVDAILADLAGLIEDTVPHLRTLYDTSVSIYGRQVEQLQAGDDPETLFVYLGPVDDIIRPFCAQWVGKVLTRDAIGALDNGQLPNVMLTGGGYNCRHGFNEISRFSELAPLAGTDDRMPEIARALQDVDVKAKAA